MSFREAVALATLLRTVNQLAPHRSKASDGWIGDAAHASRTSDHNPWVKVDGVGVVRARDFTHDPTGGMDAAVLAASLAALLGKHPAMGHGAYVIFNRQIISTDRLREGWRPYTGVNAHQHHVHVSVGLRGFDSRTPWPVKVQRGAKASRLDQARVLLRSALAATKNPVRRRRIRRALDALGAGS